MYNVSSCSFCTHADGYGKLIALEQHDEIPFSIKRVYYIFDVDGEIRRGFHSHIDLQQMLICVHGSVKILTKTPYEEETVELNDPSQGLYIGPMVWREMYDFTPGAVLLVLASMHYDESDYIRDYQNYVLLAKDYFRQKDGNVNDGSFFDTGVLA